MIKNFMDLTKINPYIFGVICSVVGFLLKTLIDSIIQSGKDDHKLLQHLDKKLAEQNIIIKHLDEKTDKISKLSDDQNNCFNKLRDLEREIKNLKENQDARIHK